MPAIIDTFNDSLNSPASERQPSSALMSGAKQISGRHLGRRWARDAMPAWYGGALKLTAPVEHRIERASRM